MSTNLFLYDIITNHDQSMPASGLLCHLVAVEMFITIDIKKPCSWG
jgi:hypothetical protein